MHFWAFFGKKINLSFLCSLINNQAKMKNNFAKASFLKILCVGKKKKKNTTQKDNPFPKG